MINISEEFSKVPCPGILDTLMLICKSNNLGEPVFTLSLNFMVQGDLAM
jgi:hypothetical protein